MIKYDTQNEIKLLETALGNIQEFDDHFVAYNTEFLGVSANDKFIIKGKDTQEAECLDEFCFGYDMYDQMHLLDVYITSSGIKFASTEIMMGVYGYWLVTEPKKKKVKSNALKCNIRHK